MALGDWCAGDNGFDFLEGLHLGILFSQSTVFVSHSALVHERFLGLKGFVKGRQSYPTTRGLLLCWLTVCFISLRTHKVGLAFSLFQP